MAPSSSQTAVTATNISVIVPTYHAASCLRLCLDHIYNSTAQAFEVIVVDDGSTDNSVDIAREYSAKVIPLGSNYGPAHARNVAARAARGDVLLFLDSDVCARPDAIERVHAAFAEDPELDALIGSYDDNPRNVDFLSRYRNLLHCYTHRHGKQRASTFWSGCGAIRRSVFIAAGGFDESYPRPSIEDIELGYRLVKAGKKILLDPDVMVKHLKHWSLPCLVRTDVRDRGIPWTELILRERYMPNDLNLKTGQRLSVALAALIVPAMLLALIQVGPTFALSLFVIPFLALASLAVAATNNLERVFAVGCLGTTAAGLAWLTGTQWLLPFMIGSLVVLWIRQRVGHNHFMNAVAGIYIGAVAVMAVYAGFGLAAIPFYAFLICLITLNWHFYLFLMGRMGLLNTFAAIPFHLFFHLYSGAAFAAGLTKYFLLPKGQSLRAKAAKGTVGIR